MSQPHDAALEAASRRKPRKLRFLPAPDFVGQVELAEIYLSDGAPISAARVLRELADKLEAHGKSYHAALEAACSGAA